MLETLLEITYLNELKSTVRAIVVSRRPIGLEKIMTEAQLIEDRDVTIQLVIDMMFGHGSSQNGPNELRKNRLFAREQA